MGLPLRRLPTLAVVGAAGAVLGSVAYRLLTRLVAYPRKRLAQSVFRDRAVALTAPTRDKLLNTVVAVAVDTVPVAAPRGPVEHRCSVAVAGAVVARAVFRSPLAQPVAILASGLLLVEVVALAVRFAPTAPLARLVLPARVARVAVAVVAPRLLAQAPATAAMAVPMVAVAVVGAGCSLAVQAPLALAVMAATVPRSSPSGSAMTGREQVTLAAFVEFATAAFERLENKVDTIDTRVRGLEQSDARQAGAVDGQAAAVAHANVVNQRIDATRNNRLNSMRTVFAIAASSATIAGVVIGIVLTLLHT